MSTHLQRAVSFCLILLVVSVVSGTQWIMVTLVYKLEWTTLVYRLVMWKYQFYLLINNRIQICFRENLDIWINQQ